MMNKKKNGFFPDLLEHLGIYRFLLDIGGDELRLIGAIVLFGRVHVLQYRHKKISGQPTPEVLKEFLSDFSGGSLHVSFSGAVCIPITFSIPKMSQERLKVVLPSEIEKSLPIIFSNIHYHYMVLSRSTEGGVSRIHILAVCVRHEEYKKILGAIRDTGIKINAAVYLPFSLPNSLKNRNLDGYTGMVVIQPHAIYLLVLDNGSPRSFTMINGSIAKSSGIAMKNIAHYYQDFTKSNGVTLKRISILPLTDKNVTGAQFKTLESLTGCKTTVLKPSDYRFRVKDDMDPSKSSDLFGYLFDSSSSHTMYLETPPWNGYRNGIVHMVLRLLLIADMVLLSLLPFRLAAIIQYGGIQKLQETDPASIRDPKQKEWAIRLAKVREQDKIKTGIRELRSSIAALKKNITAPSRITASVTEISRLIPDDTRLKSIAVNNLQVQITGVASNSRSIEQFVRALSGSKYFQAVSLKNAQSTGEIGKESVEFNISFEVVQ